MQLEVPASAVGQQLEVASTNYGKLEEDANELQNTINGALYEKQRNLDAVTKQQRMMKRYKDLREGNYPVDISEEDGPRLRAEMKGEQESLKTVRDVINNLRVEYGHLDEVLTRVLSAVSYEACARVLRWLRDPPCITQATLRPSPKVKSMDFGLYYDGYETLCVLRSLRNRRH